MSIPTISIITVTYNSAATLSASIESVLAQTYPNIEYIIVDGASTDNTPLVVKNYGTQITTFISEPDKGIYNAMNKGIALSTGDYVGFLHADDVLASPRTIANIAEAASQLSPDAIYGNLEYVAKDDLSKVIRFWESKPFEPSSLKAGWMPPHPSLYVKRQCYNAIGVFDEDFKIAADYDFILRLFSRTGIKSHYLNQVIVKMRVGGASNKSIKNIILKSKEDYKALRRNQVGGLYSLAIKNLSKVHQFFHKSQTRPNNDVAAE